MFDWLTGQIAAGGAQNRIRRELRKFFC
jgi:hypothetical protein